MPDFQPFYLFFVVQKELWFSRITFSSVFANIASIMPCSQGLSIFYHHKISLIWNNIFRKSLRSCNLLNNLRLQVIWLCTWLAGQAASRLGQTTLAADPTTSWFVGLVWLTLCRCPATFHPLMGSLCRTAVWWGVWMTDLWVAVSAGVASKPHGNRFWQSNNMLNWLNLERDILGIW